MHNHMVQLLQEARTTTLHNMLFYSIVKLSAYLRVLIPSIQKVHVVQVIMTTRLSHVDLRSSFPMLLLIGAYWP